jgi:hypothetical protein
VHPDRDVFTGSSWATRKSFSGAIAASSAATDFFATDEQRHDPVRKDDDIPKRENGE